MSTEVGIYNLALSNIGAKANVASLDELTVERQKCTQFYATCLRKVLDSHEWAFATKREVLATVTNDTDAWDFKYALPNLYLHAVAILDKGSPDWGSEAAYVVAGDFIYSNVENAELRFVYYEDNPGKFTPWFEEALAALLASRIAGPLIKGAMGRQERNQQFKEFLLALGQAKVRDSNQSRDTRTFTPSGIMARGGHSALEIEQIISERRSRRGL